MKVDICAVVPSHKNTLNIIYVASLHNRRLMVPTTRREINVFVIHLRRGNIHIRARLCYHDLFILQYSFSVCEKNRIIMI